MLPIIWLYCMFDVVQLVHRKQAGDLLIDRTLFDELESGRESGRRSKVFATLLSAFPGAGQMYLGLQKRGLQLMVLFLGSIYVLDVLKLSVFLFLIPLIWFYAFSMVCSKSAAMAGNRSGIGRSFRALAISSAGSGLDCSFLASISYLRAL